jgi:hypothetical protein
MSCRQQPTGRMDCDYSVGGDLRFAIKGVGQVDAVTSIIQVDSLGAYVAGFAALHGCVIVRPSQPGPDSLATMAFVSPQDGKVYRNWNTCLRQAPKR